MFSITSKVSRNEYIVNDVKTGADIIYGITGDAEDYERMVYILGNMRFDELFRMNNIVVQCFEDSEEKNDVCR